MPRGTGLWIATIAVIALIPFFLIARARATRFDRPRLHLIWDMDSQPKYRSQATNAMFADGRSMRPAVPGTVAIEQLNDNEHMHRGIVNGEWANTFPMPVTDAVLARGAARYDIYCTPCHGIDGSGNGIVAKRADRLAEGTWTQPSSYHTDVVRGRPVGHLFNTITNGIRNMPPYGPQIPESDRWAIVAYVRALQKSQNATLEDVPDTERGKLH